MSKCTDCGYLVLLHQFENREASANPEYRRTGKPTVGFVPGKGNMNLFDELPRCAKHAFDLPNEATEKSQHAGYLVALKERECQAFREYSPGKEVKDYDDLDSLEKLRAEQARMRGEDRADAERRHQENLELNAQNAKTARRSVAIASIALIVSAIAAASVLGRFIMEYANSR